MNYTISTKIADRHTKELHNFPDVRHIVKVIGELFPIDKVNINIGPFYDDLSVDVFMEYNFDQFLRGFSVQIRNYKNLKEAPPPGKHFTINPIFIENMYGNPFSHHYDSEASGYNSFKDIFECFLIGHKAWVKDFCKSIMAHVEKYTHKIEGKYNASDTEAKFYAREYI